MRYCVSLHRDPNTGFTGALVYRIFDSLASDGTMGECLGPDGWVAYGPYDLMPFNTLLGPDETLAEMSVDTSPAGSLLAAPSTRIVSGDRG